MDDRLVLVALVLLAVGLLVGALVVWPLAVGAAFVGWLIGGQVGAVAGLAVAGVIGLIYLSMALR